MKAFFPNMPNSPSDGIKHNRISDDSVRIVIGGGHRKGAGCLSGSGHDSPYVVVRTRHTCVLV